VNRIEKNHVSGYVSAPKYKIAETATASGTNAPEAGAGSAPLKASTANAGAETAGLVRRTDTQH
jgi:hypothetical protein